MSKKPKVIQPLFKTVETDEWWIYKEYDEKQIQAIEEWFKKNWKEVLTLLTNNFVEDIQQISKLIGVHVHPYFKTAPGYLVNHLESQDPNHQLTPEELEYFNNKYYLLNNQRIDYLSFKIFTLVWQLNEKFTVFKCMHNNLSPQVLQQLLTFVTNPANRIFKFFFEFNPIQDPEFNRQFYQAISSTNHIEFLVLRGNNLDDSILQTICEQLQKNPNSNLKYLDLYDNHITGQGLEKLGELIEKYQKFQYIGLGKNIIKSSQDINPLMKNIGKKKMSQEQIEQHHKLIQDREDLITKWTKMKKKFTDDMLPQIPSTCQLLDGSLAVMMNPQLRMLNLQLNSISDVDREYFEKMQNLLSDEFCIVLTYNNFDNKSRDKIRKKLQFHVNI